MFVSTRLGIGFDTTNSRNMKNTQNTPEKKNKSKQASRSLSKIYFFKFSG